MPASGGPPEAAGAALNRSGIQNGAARSGRYPLWAAPPGCWVMLAGCLLVRGQHVGHRLPLRAPDLELARVAVAALKDEINPPVFADIGRVHKRGRLAAGRALRQVLRDRDVV